MLLTSCSLWWWELLPSRSTWDSTWPREVGTSTSGPELWLWSRNWSSVPATFTLQHRHGVNETEREDDLEGREGDGEGGRERRRTQISEQQCWMGSKVEYYVYLFWQPLDVSRQNKGQSKLKNGRWKARPEDDGCAWQRGVASTLITCLCAFTMASGV